MHAYPRIIAHRCGGALAPENSLAGLRVAVRLGCRGVEFDVMLAADGVPLLIHDETLERTTTGHGRVDELTADAIRRFDAGAPHHPAYAVSPVPTFSEALHECQALGLWANVEIKPAAGHDAATGRAVAAMMAASPLAGHCVLSSFSAVALDNAKQIAPTVPRALLFDALPTDWRDQVRRHAAAAIHLDATRCEAAEVAALKAADIFVACYTVNSRQAAAGLFAAGVDAVFSDRPDLWAPSEM